MAFFPLCFNFLFLIALYSLGALNVVQFLPRSWAHASPKCRIAAMGEGSLPNPWSPQELWALSPRPCTGLFIQQYSTGLSCSWWFLTLLQSRWAFSHDRNWGFSRNSISSWSKTICSNPDRSAQTVDLSPSNCSSFS